MTKLKIILDRSGSMYDVGPETVDKLNEYLNGVNTDRGTEKIHVSLYQFDDEYQINYEEVLIQDVKPLVYGETYMPRGMTALLDAIGKTMSAEGAKLKKKQKGICVIVTDGFENASHEYTNAKISELIKDLEDNSAWTFVFLGANQDAFASAQAFGIRNIANTLSYGNTVEGVDSSFTKLQSATTRSLSVAAAPGMANTTEYFTPEEQEDSEKTMVTSKSKQKVSHGTRTK